MCLCYRLPPRDGLVGLNREGLAGSSAFLLKCPSAESPPPLRRPPSVPDPNRPLPDFCLPLVSAIKRACTCLFLRSSAFLFSCSRAAIAVPTRLFLLALLQNTRQSQGYQCQSPHFGAASEQWQLANGQRSIKAQCHHAVCAVRHCYSPKQKESDTQLQQSLQKSCWFQQCTRPSNPLGSAFGTWIPALSCVDA